MAGSLNKVCLFGTLGRDPDSRSFQNGGKVVNLSIATSESWKDRNSGEKKERTEWHKVAIFNEGLAGVAERFLRKGSKVYIEGQLQTRKWQKDGVDHYSTEVVLQGFNGVLILAGDKGGSGGGDSGSRGSGGRDDGWGGGGQSRGGGSGGAAGGARTGGGFGSGGFNDDLDDDVPF